METHLTLLEKIENKTARIGILGMGYVGLPLAILFAEAGFEVTGIDPLVEKVEKLNHGDSYIMDIPSEQVNRLVKSGKLCGTSDYSVLQYLDAVAICVPTPLKQTGDPDLSYIIAAIDSLIANIHSNMVIVLESSTYPGTTREMLLPSLTKKSGLIAGKNIFIAFSPERVDPGRLDWTTKNTPKIIGGITQKCTEVATKWYAKALDKVVPVSSSEVAEMAKLLENTFRMINIGFVNELAIICDRLGVDVWEVIDAASTKPFGFMRFLPGPGLGGHCIPIDPLYLSWKLHSLNYTARFIDLASEINLSMPRFVIARIQDALNEHQQPLKNSRVLVLGAAYKPNIDDLRESPAIDVISLLKQKSAIVSYYDPYIPFIKYDGWELESIKDLYNSLDSTDCVVLITDHSIFNYYKIAQKAKIIVDTRNVFSKNGIKKKNIYKL